MLHKRLPRFVICIICCSLLISAISFGAYAARISTGDYNKTYLGLFNDYGWVTFTYTTSYIENYTTVGSRNTFSSREISYSLFSSRSDVPATGGLKKEINHFNAVGTEMDSFTSFTSKSAIWPGDIISAGMLENTESVGYATTTPVYGEAYFAIHGTSEVMLDPLGKTYTLPLATS